MSSNVYLHPKKMPSVAEWREWGKTVGIEYSPRTIGGSISYAGGGHGAREVEIDFRPDWNTGPGGTGAISIGTYFMGDLQAVAEVARKIYAAYPGKMSACPELEFVIDALGAERTTEDD